MTRRGLAHRETTTGSAGTAHRPAFDELEFFELSRGDIAVLGVGPRRRRSE